MGPRDQTWVVMSHFTDPKFLEGSKAFNTSEHDVGVGNFLFYFAQDLFVYFRLDLHRSHLEGLGLLLSGRALCPGCLSRTPTPTPWVEKKPRVPVKMTVPGCQPRDSDSEGKADWAGLQECAVLIDSQCLVLLVQAFRATSRHQHHVSATEADGLSAHPSCLFSL